MIPDLIKEKLSIKPNQNDITTYKPIIYNLTTDKGKLNELLSNNSTITIFDEIEEQLKGLIKTRNPKAKFTPEELTERVHLHIENTPLEQYGIWIYYPWSNRLVHTLDKEEFIEVRTDRNKNKITHEEQELLRTKKIGIIGLSVGQSVALNLAMERVVGEISIADFDVLELSNLNRIRTGIHNLNVPKTIAVAREIAEIDPFIKINCFHEGITESNIDDFLLKDKKLDILIDECDGLYLKIFSRLRAKEHGIPVLMDTSDRGMIDVERFDLEPERSIFHGLIDHFDFPKIKEAKTDEEKVPYMLAMIGWETISDKMKASMVEVENSISTWPQLASSVNMGGGMTCDVARRILLNQYHESGRYFIDVEELINDKINTNITPTLSNDEIEIVDVEGESKIAENDMISLANNCLALNNFTSSYSVSTEMINKLVSKAILAPSGGNSQPWRWLFIKNQLFLFQNKGKTNKFLDFKSYGTILALGSATENLILEARKNNIDVKLNLFPIEHNEVLVAQIYFNQLNSINKSDYLVNYIDKRCTDRNIYPSEPIDSEILEDLKVTCSSISGAKLHFLTDKNDIKKYGNILGRSDKTLLTTKETHSEFMNEIRWNQEEVERTRTGVDLDTIDLTAAEVAGFKMIKNWSVVKYLNKWGGGSAFEKLSKKCAESAYAIGLITVPSLSSENFFYGGQALEKVWLEATKNGLNIHPISGLTYVFTRLLHGKAEGMDEKMIKTIIGLRKEHEQLFHTQGEIEVFLFRIFKGNKPVKRSLRKEIDDFLFIK